MMSSPTMLIAVLRAHARRLTGDRWPPVRDDETLVCSEVGRLLQRFLDGELDDPVTAGALAAHLDVCEPCGLEADTYRRIKLALLSHREEPGDETLARLRDFGYRLMEH
jgi:hypothetical protein